MATKKKKFNLSSFVMNSPVALWMILFVAIPFIYVVCISFMHKGTYGGVTFKFTTDNYKAIFDPLYLVTFGKSLLISLVTTIICILIAYPFTYFIAQKTEIKKAVFMSLVMIPFLVSSLIRLFNPFLLTLSSMSFKFLFLKSSLVYPKISISFPATS